MSIENQYPSIASIHAEERWIPPEWALLQRLLFDTLNQAALEFTARYTRPDGTLIWREHWPGMDGSDDPYEGFCYFPLFYVLGGSEEIHQLSRKLWDAITWQWTEYGQIYREFDAYYDWMHHGESLIYTYYYGLADPTVLKDRQRAIRFASLYTGDDPEATNYDVDKRLIRSPINGSRGPRFIQTAEDWSTHREVLDNYPPPFEDIPGVEGPTCPWSNDAVYEQILQRMNKRMSRGDVPLNLTATSLAAHAFMYTGDDRWANWVFDYLDAWKERTDRNGGITPDNVGLSGQIGEYMDGKWWGGYYGWRWPHGSFTILEPLLIAGCNAALLDGDMDHLSLFRSQLDLLWGLGHEVDGRKLVPNKHLDSGWTDYRLMNPIHPIYLWSISMDPRDQERVERLGAGEDWAQATSSFGKGWIGNTGPWYAYVTGKNPDYPTQILKVTYETIQRQLTRIRSDQGDPAGWDIHHWQLMTPMIVEGLVQLTLGAPMHIYHGGLLHARVRYYDAQAQRPGLPPSVAALVEQMSADSTTICMINLSPYEERDVIIQAGTFGEHCFDEAVVLGQDGEAAGRQQVGGKWLRVVLPPGGGIRLQLQTRRYANQPSYDTPWISQEQYSEKLQGRHPSTS